MLLLHGVPLASPTWIEVAPRLAARGHRVVAADLVGMGGSQKPLSLNYTLGGLAEFAVGLLDSVAQESEGPGWVVAGHDLGGLLALVTAARRTAQVAAAIALDTTASLDYPFPWIRLFAGRPSYLAGVFRLGQPGGLRWVVRSLWRQGGEPPEELLKAQAEAFGSPQAIWALARLVEGVAGTPVEAVESIRAELGSLRLPVLLGRGEEDLSLSRLATHDLGALIPSARLATIPGAGHLTPLEQPEKVADLMAAFIEEVVGNA